VNAVIAESEARQAARGWAQERRAEEPANGATFLSFV
jgi:hypothetical protein